MLGDILGQKPDSGEVSEFLLLHMPLPAFANIT
jgi:hypothetical protein